MIPGFENSVLAGGSAAGFADFCRAARANGWTAVEFVDGPAGIGEVECRRAAAEAAEAGVSINGLLLQSADRAFELTTDPTDRLRLALQQAVWLGAGAVRVSPGAQRAGPDQGFRLYEILLSRASDLLDALLPEAEELGVRVELRVPAPGFLLSPAEARGFLDRLNSPAVAAHLEWDSLTRISGLPADWILSLGQRLAGVRLSASFPSAETAEVRAALDRAAFSGVVVRHAAE